MPQPISRLARFAVSLTVATLAVLIVSAPVRAGHLDGRGPQVGAALPHPLSAKDQFGKARSFDTLGGKRGLILLFTRSLDW